MFSHHLPLLRFNQPQAPDHQKLSRQHAAYERTPMPQHHDFSTDLAMLNGSQSAAVYPVVSDVFFAHPIAEGTELAEFMQSPEQLTAKEDPDEEDIFETPRAYSNSTVSNAGLSRGSSTTTSAFSTAPSSVSGDEDLIEVVHVNPKPRYSQYLEALSDADLAHRKDRHKHKANHYNRQLESWHGNPEAPTDPNYIDTLRKARKHQAEHDLANGELLFRDILDGRAEAFTPEARQSFDKHMADCAAEVDDYWQRESNPPELTEQVVRFLTKPYSNSYMRYIQEQTDEQLQNRRNTYKSALADSEAKLNQEVQHGSRPTGYAYQVKREPKGMNIFSRLMHKKYAAESRDRINKNQESHLPIVGRSLFADEEWQKVKDIGKYQAEKYLADAELYRRNVNRGSQEIPGPVYLSGILDNIDEYIADVVTEFKPQPIKKAEQKD